MTNKQLLEKLKEDMEMRGFSKHTKASYYRKAKEITEYFKKPMRQVKIQELRDYLLKYLRQERGLTEKSVNYYNNVIRFIYDVVIDVPINKRQLPLYKGKRRLPKILSYENVNVNIKMYNLSNLKMYNFVHS